MNTEEIIQLANRLVGNIIQWILVEGCEDAELVDLAYETINVVDSVIETLSAI